MSVKRYYTNVKDSEMFEGADGPFVLYSDYAKLHSLITLEACEARELQTYVDELLAAQKDLDPQSEEFIRLCRAESYLKQAIEILSEEIK